jgi:hypothetical protein
VHHDHGVATVINVLMGPLSSANIILFIDLRTSQISATKLWGFGVAFLKKPAVLGK